MPLSAPIPTPSDVGASTFQWSSTDEMRRRLPGATFYQSISLEEQESGLYVAYLNEARDDNDEYLAIGASFVGGNKVEAIREAQSKADTRLFTAAIYADCVTSISRYVQAGVSPEHVVQCIRRLSHPEIASAIFAFTSALVAKQALMPPMRARRLSVLQP